MRVVRRRMRFAAVIFSRMVVVNARLSRADARTAAAMVLERQGVFAVVTMGELRRIARLV